MDVTLSNPGSTAVADTRALLVLQDEPPVARTAAPLDVAVPPLVRALLASGDFAGRALETAILHPAAGRVRRVLLVGIGPRDSLTSQRVRQVAATLARRATDLGARRVVVELPDARVLNPAIAAQAFAEGAVMGSHRFDRYRAARKTAEPRIEIVPPSRDLAPAVRAAIALGLVVGRAVCLARDLANTPGQDLPPRELAATATRIGRASGARVRVLGVRDMERLGMGAVLGVGRGSVEPPCFIVLERDPTAGGRRRPGGRTAKGAANSAGKRGAVPTVVLIGKGVTFDTGGISLKPREGMGRMKYDMSGAAAVLGVFAALPALELPFRVVGLVPSAENMPSDRAFKPGDVLRAMDGTTIEVTNTDAEGRLLLADALCYAQRYQPEVIVDLATLTGSIRVALGTLAAGLFTTDDPLAAELAAASAATGDRLWRMPLWDDYADSLKSDVADVVNSAGGDGGASIAASFLARFAGDTRWAHIDMASTAWAFTDRPHEPRGPTGFGVRLLLEWLVRRSGR